MTCFRLKSGETLHKYCYRTGENYNLIARRIDEKGMSVEEAIEDYKNREVRLSKYKTTGQSLRSFCLKNDLDYMAIYQYMYRYKCGLNMAVEWYKQRKDKQK